MKEHMHSIRLPILLALFLCISALTAAVPAAGDSIAEAVIPVSVTVSGEEGTLSSDIPTETYTFVLEASENEPMPESSSLTVTGAGSAEFAISYDRVGVYQYTLRQDASALSGANSSCHERGNYDTAVYYVTVTVTNTESGNFGVVVSAHKGSASADKSELEFENTYDPVPYTVLTVKKIWTDNAQTRPESIEVQLLDGETVVETVRLTKDSWAYTWDRLDPYGDHSWDVKEVAVKGYTAEYSKSSDGTITIHNVGEQKPSKPSSPSRSDSPKTGDTSAASLWMLVMLIAGVIGYAELRRKRKNP